MEKDYFQKLLDEAELILVGLGDDFNDSKSLANSNIFNKGKEWLEKKDLLHLLPAWKEYCSDRMDSKVADALQFLRKLLGEKNAFIVSIATDKRIVAVPWKNNRFVLPLGTTLQKQCLARCNADLSDEERLNAEAYIYDVTETDLGNISTLFDELFTDQIAEKADLLSEGLHVDLGVCPHCGAKLVLNTVYADEYDELGYLQQWAVYQKWLQGTVNKKTIMLELGVGMNFPSVVRWPFEKIAFYNKKSTLVRVDEKWYQLPDNIDGRGISIKQNAVEWLQSLVQ